MYILQGNPFESKYYTYMLVNPTTHKPFYVGKGTGKRYLDHFKEALVGKGVNHHKTNTIRKIVASNESVIVAIVMVSDNASECYEHEKMLIAKFGRKNNRTGFLVNLTDGGEGGSYPHSDAHKQKLTMINPGGLATSKEIYQIDANTGQVLAIWPSTRKAGITLGIHSWRNISSTANHLKNRTVGGFFWRWTTDPDVVDMMLPVASINITRLDNSTRSSKKVLCKDFEGHTVATYVSLSQACRERHIKVSTLSAAVKRQRPCCGYLWQFA